jgi:hypothetical protein
LTLPLSKQSGQVAVGGGYTSSDRTNANDELNNVVAEGWRLLSASAVFVPATQVSRDRMVLTGQHLAVSGEVVGVYVFTRDETKRQTTASDASEHRPANGAPQVVRHRRSAGEVEPLRPLSE